MFAVSGSLVAQSHQIADVDGNYYNIVTIGTQVWMAENLKTTKFNDNTIITNVTDNIEWEALATPGYCWYNNEADYKSTYRSIIQLVCSR